ncbi:MULTISPECIES: hypothetical protein [Halomonas]|nr:hypothetical protein [Halomonas salina]
MSVVDGIGEDWKEKREKKEKKHETKRADHLAEIGASGMPPFRATTMAP